jgi:hypothetical protein
MVDLLSFQLAAPLILPVPAILYQTVLLDEQMFGTFLKLASSNIVVTISLVAARNKFLPCMRGFLYVMILYTAS